MPDELEKPEPRSQGDPSHESAPVNLDEDLFDFPNQQVSQSVSAGQEPLSPVTESVDPILEALQEPAQVAESVPPPSSDFGIHADEDEDLFDFPVIQALSESNPAEIHPIDTEFESPGDLLIGTVDEDLLALINPGDKNDEMRSRLEDGAQDDEYSYSRSGSPAEPVMSAETGTSTGGTTLASLPEETLAAIAAMTRDDLGRTPATKSSLPRNRLLWTLVAPSIVANLVLVIFAWKASAAFDANVSDLRQEVFETVSDMRRESILSDVRTDPPGYTRLPEPDPGRQDEAPPDDRDALTEDTALETGEKLQLRVAREEIEARSFASARKRLFRLLVLMDGLTSPDRDEVEAQASFLIASTYRLQALEARERAR